MSEHGDLPVYMPRQDWEHIMAALNTATAPTPLSRRLRQRIDDSLNAAIDAAIERHNAIPEEG